MTRKECINLLTVKMSDATGHSRTVCREFAERMIEPFNIRAEADKYYNDYADAIENDFNFWLTKFKEK